MLELNGYALETALGYSSAPQASLVKRLFHAASEAIPTKLISSHACEGLIMVAKAQ
jgi:hypothetical protein